MTPKGHVKIDNREKILNKNNSLALLKKNDKKESGFKRKSKPVVQIFNGLEEVFEMKNDIKNLCEIASHCAS